MAKTRQVKNLFSCCWTAFPPRSSQFQSDLLQWIGWGSCRRLQGNIWHKLTRDITCCVMAGLAIKGKRREFREVGHLLPKNRLGIGLPLGNGEWLPLHVLFLFSFSLLPLPLHLLIYYIFISTPVFSSFYSFPLPCPMEGGGVTCVVLSCSPVLTHNRGTRGKTAVWDLDIPSI